MTVLGLVGLLVTVGVSAWFLFTRKQCALCGKRVKATHRYRYKGTHSMNWCDECAEKAHPAWVRIDDD